MIHRSARHPGWFTLVEALCAGVVLCIFSVMIGAGLSNTAAMDMVARDKQQGALLLDELLTKIDTIGPSRLLREGPSDGEFAEPHEEVTWQVEITEPLEGYLYEIEVTIQWQTPRGQRSIAGYTMLNDPPGARSGSLQWEDL